MCDYPVTEAIRSVLPLCDEFVIAVGKSEDNTLELIQQIDPVKIKILQTEWDENLREGGRVFAVETDKAFHAIAPDSDWAFYIQADEIVHENTLDAVHHSMLRWKDDKRVEGLLFDFIHFYGSYGYVANAYNWHRREVRIIRNDRNIFSYNDSMGFRKKPNEKLHVKHSGGTIYHYSYVKPPERMLTKAKEMDKRWHPDEVVEQKYEGIQEFDYSKIDSLQAFAGTHPQVMQARVNAQNWDFTHDPSRNYLRPKYRLRAWIEQLTGINIGEYKNYRLLP